MRTRSSLDYGDAQRIVHACGAHCSALRLLHLGNQLGSHWRCVFCRSLYKAVRGRFVLTCTKYVCVWKQAAREWHGRADGGGAEGGGRGRRIRAAVRGFIFVSIFYMYVYPSMADPFDRSNTPCNPNTSRALESLSLGWRGLPQEAFKVR